VVIGSLTQLGEALNIDARVIDVSTANILPMVFVQGKGLANLDLIAGKLKTEILVRIGLIQKIAGIEIRGNRKIEASVILMQIKSKSGQ